MKVEVQMTFDRSIILSTGLLVVLAVTTNQAQIRASEPSRKAQIKQEIEKKFSEEKFLEDLTVDVEERTVTLTGSVPSAWAKEQAIETARKVAGVEWLISELTIPKAESDAILGQQVANEILRYVLYTMFDSVDIGVDQGTVILVGQVTEPHKANEIVRRASRVAGTQEVRNEIEVLPASPMDDRLRQLIATQIYRHDMFRRYANRANPPIHIILKNSRVTLTGVAASNIEKAIAGRIARQTFGVFSVENKLQIMSR